ncbi:hypothetical protein CpB0436 [Chlamydia pneumoniae TW-183]|uniref:Cell division protein FtsL n=2 Tax=Chlamydia pneumoniae TaxID=83558 RepID=Q9Z8C3_CHLPN|nr:hypothetical protein [Chlamydia pneumoniae]AAD18564.1 CT271 hypothetical protein [Chlamydia pneumoniae CWL029]AAF38188.1 hypothetical protein CP_0334 [Chlamydia pneumoniae AR39]AAP98367.1 hypothetical protein CpB0436 [Chlamydia pneumoniae TW-183]ACZ33396.1 conserved hypothetical protein [Chlamydia pneumoniae LPCoLN]CRI32922.1 hypothetical protein BN1224_Wien1_A_04290 [Chlamydia pneumoniae]
MNKSRFLRLCCCLCFCGSLFYFYINKQNSLTKLRLEIPCLSVRLRQLEQQNISLRFLIDKIERPDHLMEIAALPEYQYLEYPSEESISLLSYELP